MDLPTGTGPDPYRPPASSVGAAPNASVAPGSMARGVLRVTGWALVLFVVIAAVTVATAVAFGIQVCLPGNVQCLLGTLPRHAPTAVAIFLVYRGFLRHTRHARAASCMALYLLTQAGQWVLGIGVGDWMFAGLHLGAAVLALRTSGVTFRLARG